jgi:hypothetical protein
VDAATLSTISAFAAAAAAGGAFTVAGIQLYVGFRQSKAALRQSDAALKQSDAALTSANAALMNAQTSGRHTLAELRQAWIYKVIDTLCDHHSILMTKPEDQELPAADQRALAAARTKLEILLNPEEDDIIALFKSLDEIDTGTVPTERDIRAGKMLIAARSLLKKEWVRVKAELE